MHGPSLPFIADPKLTTTNLVALCSKLNAVYEECEWAAALMHDDPLVLPKISADESHQPFSAAKMELALAARTDQMRLFCAYTSQAVKACAALVSDDLPLDRSRDQILKLCLRHYKLMASLLKSLLAARPLDIASHVESLLDKTRSLTINIYSLLSLDSATNVMGQGDEAQRRAAAGSALKEARLVPNLIFQIEQYNVNLLRLSKVATHSEEVLSSLVVDSLNRDFKISKAKPPKKRKAPSKQLENITNIVQNDEIEEAT
jgi:hypothetical protein